MTSKSHGSAGRWIAGVFGLGAVLALAACGGGGGSSGSTAGQGTLQMSITDAPACYESVLVTVEKVRVSTSDSSGDGDGGWKEIVPANGPVQVDLVNLTNGQLAALGSATVDAGTYRQVRLVLSPNTQADPLRNAVKPIGGTLQPLVTPSGQQSGLKIKSEVAVGAGEVKDMVLDFDACKSIVLTGSGTYLLKPVVRLGEKVASGIEGYVATSMTPSSTTVSAQQGGVVMRSTVPDSTGKFKLAYLPAGTYTVVIAADGHATGVVDKVVVGTSTLAINGTASAISLPASTMNSVTGTVTSSQVSGTTTTAVPVDDAMVSALQTVSGTQAEVRSAKVDDDAGSYTIRLPAAAPLKAPYAASGLTFTADPSAAGKYTLQATAEGRAPLLQDADVSGGNVTRNFAY